MHCCASRDEAQCGLHCAQSMLRQTSCCTAWSKTDRSARKVLTVFEVRSYGDAVTVLVAEDISQHLLNQWRQLAFCRRTAFIDGSAHSGWQAAGRASRGAQSHLLQQPQVNIQCACVLQLARWQSAWHRPHSCCSSMLLPFADVARALPANVPSRKPPKRWAACALQMVSALTTAPRSFVKS